MVSKNWRAVVNLSLGGDKDAELEGAVSELTKLGIPVVCAAGNTAEDSGFFSPASLGSCITVGAADPEGYAAHFSNYGSALDVFAPGVEAVTSAAVAEICRVGMLKLEKYDESGTLLPKAERPPTYSPTLSKTTFPGDDLYTAASGTSFSAPIVTGIVASYFSTMQPSGRTEKRSSEKMASAETRLS